MLKPQDHAVFSVCENTNTYDAEFGRLDDSDGVYKGVNLWRVYIHGINREVFVIAATASDAESQAGCKYNLSGLTVTTEKQPFLIRGWSKREF